MKTPLLAVAFALLSQQASAATINVTTTADEFNSGAGCGLREAVQAANSNSAFGGCSAGSGTDTINLPSGFYTLSRGNFASFADIDEDANSVVDIDIASSLNIQGTASATLSIGNTTGNYRGRIFHVISGTVTISNVTIRDGSNPTGRFGGGLRTNPGSNVTLNSVRVTLNDADGGGGGIESEGNMTLNNSQVDNNKTTNAFEGGGGLYSASGTLTLNDSRVLANRTEGNGANGHGAGIYVESDSVLNLDNSIVDSNVIAVGGVIGDFVDGNGGGIYSLGPVNIEQSTISNNVAAGNFATGGGIDCFNRDVRSRISRTLISGNLADNNPDLTTETPTAGGIFCGNVDILDSVISANESKGVVGGIDVDRASIVRTSIIGNISNGDCGGIRTGSVSTDIVDSTISGNRADDDGGGLCVSGPGVPPGTRLRSTTVSGNLSNANGLGGGTGGGIFVGQGVVSIGNSVLANNVEGGVGDHDDCDGTITSVGHNLIANASGCSLLNSANDQLNVSAALGNLADNGGPTVGAIGALAALRTQLPTAGSTLVDRGNPGGCRDGNNLLLSVDQVGNPRTADGPDPDTIATCDIGAMEFPAVVVIDPIFANRFE